jgi:2-dehydropantoate 2-reductase
VRVAVVGAGAIGCTLGGVLAARGGAEVTLIARGAQLEALRRDGLRLGLPDGELRLRLPAEGELRERPDLLVLAVKRPDLDGAAKAASQVARGARALTVQNGLGAEEEAARHVGDDIVGGVTGIIAEFTKPGVVRAARLGMVLGRARGPADAGVREVAGLLQRAGIPSSSTDHFEGARWTKLLLNLNNALPAATGRGVRELYTNPRVPRLAAAMFREGWRVARAEGVALEPLPLAHPRLLRAIAALPLPLAAKLVQRRALRLTKEADITGSTLQSLLRGRPTEVEWLNGEVVRRGAARGVATPVNAALLEAVHRVERTGVFLPVERLAALAP